MSGYIPKRVRYGRIRTKTNQPGLKQQGTFGTVGRSGRIIAAIGRRVNPLVKTCGPRCIYGVNAVIEEDRNNVINPVLSNYCTWVFNGQNGQYCKCPQPPSRGLAGGVGNIWTPHRRVRYPCYRPLTDCPTASSFCTNNSCCGATKPRKKDTLYKSVPNEIWGWYEYAWEKRCGIDPPGHGPPPQNMNNKAPNIGITFAGASMSNGITPNPPCKPNAAWQDVKCCPPITAFPKGKNGLNFISIGGGTSQGVDGKTDCLNSFKKTDINLYYIRKNDNFLNNQIIPYSNYNGVCFDIESVGAAINGDEEVTIADLQNMFRATKEKGLIVMVTISYFGNPNNPQQVMPDGTVKYLWPQSSSTGGNYVEDLVVNTLTNPYYVDILSPQLYTAGCTTVPPGGTWNGTAGGPNGGDWIGITDAMKTAYANAENTIAPTINSIGTVADWNNYSSTWSGLAGPDGPPKAPAGFFSFCYKYTCSPIAPTRYPGCT